MYPTWISHDPKHEYTTRVDLPVCPLEVARFKLPISSRIDKSRRCGHIPRQMAMSSDGYASHSGAVLGAWMINDSLDSLSYLACCSS